MADRGPHVFISYQRTDAEFARQVRTHLLDHGVRTWMDEYDIPVGAYWPDEIDKGLLASTVVVGVLSPDAVESRNVKNEWDWAITNGKRLVLLQAQPTVIPHRYTAINYIDASGAAKDAALERLLRTLGVAAVEDELRSPEQGREPPKGPSSLPSPLTSFIGRNRERDELVTMLSGDAGPRLVTLTGPGGIGKTRLALQTAHDLVARFRDGSYFVPLAPITDPALVPVALARELDVRESAEQQVLPNVIGYLREKRILLVLDNLEQVIDAAPMIARLLMECPGIRILTTSRMPLHISGEHEFPVPPLEVPGHGRVDTDDQFSQYQAVALFIERAQAANPTFDVTSANAPAIAEICHRLEGLPLAIELAAARCRILSPHALLERLEHRLPLLTGGARDLPARQQTIRNTIAWSYDLLSDDEQRLYQRLSVFVGGWTLESAFAVADGDELLVLDGLTSLVDRSLVQQRTQPDDPDDAMRFSMLETVREFGLEQLEASGDADAVRARHAAWAVTLVEAADPGLRRPDQPRWFRQLMIEQDNLRAAMRWTLADEHDPNLGARIVAALVWFWFTSDQFREGRGWLRQALDSVADDDPAMRAQLQMGIGLMAWRLGDATGAVPALEESLLGLEATGGAWNAAFTLHHLGHAYDDAGRHEDGVAHFNTSIDRFRAIGSEWGVAVGKNCLGRSLLAAGSVSQARALLEESLATLRIIGDAWFLSNALHRLGDAILAQGDLEASRENYRESLAIGARQADEIVIADALVRLAQIATALGELEPAVQMFGGAEAIHDEHGITLYEPLRPTYELALSRLRAGLGDEAFTRLWSVGRKLPRETLIAKAMGAVGPNQG